MSEREMKLAMKELHTMGFFLTVSTALLCLDAILY
jgi:hypothetical protein